MIETPSLECKALRKSYSAGGEFALGGRNGGVSLTVGRGELFALVGPSGCGKTTTLRIIGGFLEPDSGSVLIDGKDVTRRPPYARPTNTVFQSYALFPHMSIGANVAFGLTMERVDRKERTKRASEALELVGLNGFERRKVSELSGGQQQRAALARAIVKRPAVLLLDEPLGALDLKLRKEMQDELVRLKKSTSTTFIHVTHDQEEACAVADRIGVMKDGQVVQVDQPFALHRTPRTSFVASFLDAGTIIRGRNAVRGDVVEIDGEVLVRGPRPASMPDRPLAALLPADLLTIAAAPADGARVATASGAMGVVTRTVFTGSSFLVFIKVSDALELKADLTIDELADLGDAAQIGAHVQVSWKPECVILVEDADDSEADPSRSEAS
jgi:ABC-type Fe3+/spermidine/putrescine transport system ATPase subunit